MIYFHKCDGCGFESDVQANMSDTPRTNCPVCDQDTFLRRVKNAPAMKIGHSIRGDGIEYREDLARFPGDRRAMVSGLRDLQRLIDQTKKEGAQVRPLHEARSATPPVTDPNRSLAREAYEAAKAKGFQVEE